MELLDVTDFLIGSLGIVIIFAFAALAFRAGWLMYKEQNYVAALGGIFLGVIWLGSVLIATSQVIIPWLVILTIAIFVWFWNVSSNRFQAIVSGIFGWFILGLIVMAGVLTFVKGH